ncbi:MG2 domain-containing protein [Flavobacterium alkalisoli]|uniref:alpha-2-macroglobulin family protein n=1 Tax=Flavobacterium alkalisoli TaxID=2602769 RepID=UPI003A8ED5FA
MKKALLLFILIIGFTVNAQDYNDRWEKVINYEIDGKIKSADKETDEILEHARKDRNEPQIIKAFFFKARHMQTLEENAQVKIFALLREEKEKASVPGKALMDFLYASTLKKFYNSINYKISNITYIEDAVPEDIMEWSRKNFTEAISEAYEQSIKSRDILYNVPLSDYDAIMELNPILAKTNRSLYDFLLEQYIVQYNMDLKTETVGILFADSETFQKADLRQYSASYNAIVLLQDTEKLYQSNNDSLNLQRAILRRLAFFDRHYNFYLAKENKNTIYLNTLIEVTEKWNKTPFLFEAKLRMAQIYYDLSSKDKHPEYRKKAVELCNEIIENSRYNHVASNAADLLNTLSKKQCNIETEKYIIPNKPFLAKVKFLNIDTLYVKLYKVNSNHDVIPNKNVEVTIFKYSLPKKADYFEYETELIIPAMQSGYYLLEVSSTEENEIYSKKAKITISNLASVEQQESNTKYSHYRILNRESGEPVKNAKILYAEKKYTTDKNGKAIIKQPKYKKGDGPKSKTPLIYYKKDTLSSYNHVQYSYRSENKNISKKSENDTPDIDVTGKIFTDRAIYRPGQTVYFKGIITQKVNSVYSVVPDIYVSIYITDSQGNELKTYRLKTNEFGSFSGEFQIPKNALTGEFEIEVDEDEDYELDENYNKVKDEHPFWDSENIYFDTFYKEFSVEEYKRPTFEIEFDKVKTSVLIDKPAVITGTARALNGANLTEAVVEYTISGFPDGSQDGEVKTDKDGKFTIEFIPKAPEDSDETELPVFTYDISVEVTDINGETHDKKFNVKAGYHDLRFYVYTPYQFTSEKKDKMWIESLNLNNYNIKSEAQVTIYKLIDEESKIKRDRPWLEPEIQTITQEEFEKTFPYIPYKKAKKLTEREKVVYSQKLNLQDKENILTHDFSEWETGRYEIVVSTTDSTNHYIEYKNDFSFENTDKYSEQYIFKFKKLNENYITDGYIELELASSLDNLYVAIEAFTDGKRNYDKVVHLQNNKSTIKIPFTTNQHKAEVKYYYIWQNDFYSEVQKFDLRDNDEETLQITSYTLRSTLTPGNKETWSFSIKGNGKERFEALASMYDASLDQFKTDYWQDNTLREREYKYYHTPYLQTTVGGNVNTWGYSYYKSTDIYSFTTPDKINSFGFDINGSRFIFEKPATQKKILAEVGYEIKGVVGDELGPLPGANVILKGTQVSGQTNIDGEYTITASKGDVLEFSFTGYETILVTVDDATVYNVMMEEGMALSMVVKDVYRATTTKKSAMAVASVSGVAIEGRTNASILQSLQGQVAGLNIGTGSGQPGADSTIILRGVSSIDGNPQPLFIVDGVPVDEEGFRSLKTTDIANIEVYKDAAATSIYGNRGANGVIVISTYNALIQQSEELKKVGTRKNLDETAFFYPHLTTDKDGNLSFTFTTPEALTEWSMRLFAHSKDAKSGYFEHWAITQKDLMVMPNMPRFLRETDTIVISAKVTNMTAAPKTGNAMLMLYNAVDMQPIDDIALNSNNVKPFTVPGKGNTMVNWKITVPRGMEGIQYKVVAKTENYTDGVESILPVLTNRTLVTESIPLWVKPNETKEYTLEKLKNNTSSTLKSHKIVFEYTSNPAWIAIQSLPYLMEYEHQCSEQLFSRIYANTIAASILDSNPKIKEVFDSWKKEGAPTSKLEQNEELKSIILAESPWLLDTESEAEKKNRIALLFDLYRMKGSIAANLAVLEDRQNESGGFAWFEGGKENEYITRHILAGMGHLAKLKMEDPEEYSSEYITKKGIKYIDKCFTEAERERAKKDKKSAINSAYVPLHYLYTRSFYTKQYPVQDSLKIRIDKYIDNIKDNWLEYRLYEKGMAALVLNRFGDTITAKKITESLRETSSNNTEWGMYWISNKAGWYWYESPIETQALLIEAMIEIDNDIESADAMKVWLIKNKQNKNWPTTKATTEAVYALLMKGGEWLSVKDKTSISLGNTEALNKKLAENSKEAGTGYLKLEWDSKEITKELADLKIENKSTVPGYGGLYWQYFEDLDKIEDAQKGIMNITKELYLKNKSGSEASLSQITQQTPLKTGDLVTVRIILKLTEDMEYVHLKDMRASAFEPVDVISGYKWEKGMSYYKSTKDAATHFFFDRLNKGTYLLEYDVRVNNAGEFSNGISTIQSMYAPEFSGHTKGIRIKAIP